MARLEDTLLFIGVTLRLDRIGGQKVAQEKIVLPYRTPQRDGVHVESGWQTFAEVGPPRNAGLAECLVPERLEPVRDCWRSRQAVQPKHDVHDRFGGHAANSRAADVLDSCSRDRERVTENSALVSKLGDPGGTVRLDRNCFIDIHLSAVLVHNIVIRLAKRTPRIVGGP